MVVAEDSSTTALPSLVSAEKGIIPALESAHAIAYAITAAPKLPKDYIQ